MSAETEPTQSLHRRTNWWGAFVIGLAGTILVTGIAPFAVQGMGAASVPVFIAVTAAGVMLCFCLAELAAMMPHRTGGLPSYAYETYKVFGPGVARHVGGVSAWAYWLGWFPVAPINMILAATYIARLWQLPVGTELSPLGAPIGFTVLLIAIGGLVLLFIPCYLGIHLGASFATLLGLVSMVPITALIFLPIFTTSTVDWGHLAGFTLAEPQSGGLAFYASWIFIMTWSVLAMEAAACYIGECRSPARDAKIAMTASGLYGFFIYAAIPIMLVAVLGSTQNNEPLTVFLDYTKAIFGERSRAEWIIGIPLVVALLLSVLNAIMGCARSLYQASQDGVLPKFFQHTNRHGVPDFAMAFNLVCSVLVVFFGSPLEIYIFSNMGYLFSLCLAMIGYFLYRQWRAELPRPVRMPGSLRYLSLAAGLFFLVVWIYGGYNASDIAVGEGKRWLFFLGLAIMLMYLPLYAYRRIVEDRRGPETVAPETDDLEPAEAAT